jgi:integrase
MPSTVLLDIAGRRRSPATLPAFHAGRPPHNNGVRYPADPTTVEEIIAVMHATGDDAEGVRLRGLIVVLWRAGLRISEALALAESDLDPGRGAILVRHGKGGKRREVGMDRWAWDQLAPWLTLRSALPVGALFCILRGPTRGRPWAPAGVRTQLHAAAARAGVRRRFAPHQLRHAHAVEMSREGVPLLVIQRQLGHADLAITSVYLRGIDTPRSSTLSTNVQRRWSPRKILIASWHILSRQEPFKPPQRVADPAVVSASSRCFLAA